MRWATLLLLLLAAPSFAADRPTVLLLPLDGPSGPEGETVAEAARDLLAASLSRPDGPRLVDRDALDAVLTEQALTAKLTGEAAMKVGRLLRADRAVKGTVGRDGDGWRVVFTAFEVPSGVMIGTAEERGTLAGAVTGAAVRVARLLSEATDPGPLRADDRAAASLHYLRGVGALRAGLTWEAIGEFLEARRLAVRFPETRFWMARAWLDAGESDHAAIEARAFLAAAPDHALAEGARAILKRAGAAEPDVALPEADPTADLAEVLLGAAETADRLAAAEKLIAMGEVAAPALLEAALRDPDLRVRLRAMRALAEIDPERFVVAALDNASLARNRLRKKLIEHLSPERARALARGLLGKTTAERQITEQKVSKLLSLLTGTHREAMLAVAEEAAGSDDEAISLSGMRMLTGRKNDALLDIIEARIADPTFSESYRAETLRLLYSLPFLMDRLADELIALLESDSAFMRQEAWIGLRYVGDQELRERSSQACRRLVESRRWPSESSSYATYVDWSKVEGADTLYGTLLRSKIAEERAAALEILFDLDPERATELAFDLLRDPAGKVRMHAAFHLEKHASGEEAIDRMLSRWGAVVRPETDPLPHIRPDVSSYMRALNKIAKRDLRWGSSGMYAPQPPGVGDGPETWQRWYRYWKPRAERFAKLLDGFREADADEQARRLVAMAETGHPGIYDCYSLNWGNEHPLKDAWREAMLVLAETLQVPANERPGSDATDGEVRLFAHNLRYRIRNWQGWRGK